MLDVIMRFIPDKVKTQIKDRVVDILSEASPDDRWRKLIRSFHSDAAFLSAFDAGLERAVKRFVAEYEDKELVEALTQNTRFWNLPSVQKALKEVITRPSSYLAAERDTLIDTFAEVVANKPPERVEQAVRFFLHCLAEEVINIPQLFPLYQVQLQKASLEQAREMVAVLRELQTDQRQTMTALLDTVTQNQLLLPSANQATVPAAPKIYHNLPRPDYSDFVGREPEKKKVITLLSPKKREWVITIDGVGGVGKSALALEVAYHFLNKATTLPKDEQFEVIIWTSAKQTVLTADGIRSRPKVLRTLEDIFTAISITLDREDIIRAHADEQPALITEALAERRTLLIVDNLETVDDDRLLEFLRELPNPTKAIVTTRHRIDVASPVRLVGMSELEALALIGHLSQEKEVAISEEEALKVYNRTGGLPLAIVWSISLMSFGHSVDSVLARLGSARSDIIKFSFQSSLEAIKDKEAYKLLLALSLFAKDASREALGYVSGFGEDVISRDDALVILEKLSLINKNGNRFSLLPLTRVFSLTELEQSPQLKSALTEKLSDHFLNIFKSEDLSYQELIQLETEIPNLLGFIDRCWVEGETRLIWEVLRQNRRLFWSRGYYANEYYDHLRRLQKTFLVEEVDSELVGRITAELGTILEANGEFEEAKALFKQAIPILEKQNKIRQLLRAYRYMAEISSYSGELSEARQYLERAYKSAHLSDKMEGDLMLAKRAQAIVEISVANYDLAAELLENYIAFHESRVIPKETDTGTMAYALLGRVETFRKNFDKAQAHLETALSIVQYTQIKHDIAYVHQCFALLKLSKGEIEEAKKNAETARIIYKQLARKKDLAETEQIIAQCQENKS